jgi:hypothetical protein
MISVINDKGHNFVRDGLFRMGYDRKTLRPYRTKRFNITFHSKNLEESEDDSSKPMEILTRETLASNIDQDVTDMVIKSNGSIFHEDENGLVIYEHYLNTK